VLECLGADRGDGMAAGLATAGARAGPLSTTVRLQGLPRPVPNAANRRAGPWHPADRRRACGL